jgi:hypothetical protein
MPRKNSDPLTYTHVLQLRLNDPQMQALRLAAAEAGTGLGPVARAYVSAALQHNYPEFFAHLDPVDARMLAGDLEDE